MLKFKALPESGEKDYSGSYSDTSFWNKLQRYGRKAGIKVIYAGLLLFYALKEPATPGWAKGVILSALGYFISPIDGIADVIPVAGYSDDLGVLVLALAAVAMFINDHVKEQARKRLLSWFPNATEGELAEIDEKLKKES